MVGMSCERPRWVLQTFSQWIHGKPVISFSFDSNEATSAAMASICSFNATSPRQPASISINSHFTLHHAPPASCQMNFKLIFIIIYGPCFQTISLLLTMIWQTYVTILNYSMGRKYGLFSLKNMWKNKTFCWFYGETTINTQ